MHFFQNGCSNKKPFTYKPNWEVLYAGFCKICDSLWKIHNPEPSDCFRTYCNQTFCFFLVNNPSYIRSLERYFITVFSKILEVRYIYPNPRCWKHECFIYIFQYLFVFHRKKTLHISGHYEGVWCTWFSIFFRIMKKTAPSPYISGWNCFFDVKIVYNMVKLSKSIWIPSPHFLVLYWWYLPVLFESLRQKVWENW